jgi:hypothetical protein
MKKLLLALFVLLPIVSSAMRIEKDEIDEFTGMRTIITSWEALSDDEIHFRFRYQGNVDMLDMKFRSGTAIVITEDDLLLLKSTTNEINKFIPTRTFHGGVGDGAIDIWGSGLWGIFATYIGDVNWFADNQVRLIRIQSAEGYYDRKVSEVEAKKVSMLYDIYKGTKEDEVGVQKYADYKLKYLKKRTKEKSWDVVKEEYRECISEKELLGIMQEWRSQSDDNTQYEIMPKKVDKKNKKGK